MNNDGQQFHQYQQSVSTPLISSHLSWGNLGPGLWYAKPCGGMIKPFMGSKIPHPV